MATFTILNTAIPSNLLYSPNKPSRFQTRSKSITPFSQHSLSSSSSSFLFPTSWNETEHKKKKRGLETITRAGPSSTSLIFAFVMPLTLILATVFTSIRIADKLDEDFLEEIAVNKAIMEGKDEGDDGSTLTDEKITIPTWAQEKPEAPRFRNRPKREAEVET